MDGVKCVTCGVIGCERGVEKDAKGIPQHLKERKLKDNLSFQAMCDRLSMRIDLILELKRRNKGESV